MNPEKVFCANLGCPASGQVGKGNIKVHSQKTKRYRCAVCTKTFTTSKGTLFYRLRTEPSTVILVLTLLVYGCPIKAIVAGFGLNEKTVRNWLKRAGQHSQAVHEHLVGESKLDLGQVQADEIKVKVQGGTIWMAMGMQVKTRLWLGGVISPKRDRDLIAGLMAQIRAVALCRPLLIAVDGLSTYVGQVRKAFRSPIPRSGKRGRPRLRPWDQIAIVQVVKQRSAETKTITRRIMQGCPAMIGHLIQHSQGGGSINTAYIERLNATFRQRLAPLVRRSRSLARQPQSLHHGMFFLGCVYNFCTYHASLSVPLVTGAHSRRILHSTPACAAGLTDHCWSIQELFEFRVPTPRWSPPKRRGRHSKQTLALIRQWCQ